MSNHPNRLPFAGLLTWLDKPSNKSPNGARDRRLILTEQAAREALPSLIGMGINANLPDLSTHDARRKLGVIDRAIIEDGAIKVFGYVFAKDFPDFVNAAKEHELGMSYEMGRTHVDDMCADIWKIVKTTFTGAAVLMRDKAAYEDTRFELDVKLDQRRQIDAAFSMMTEDENYHQEASLISEEFEASDWETLREK